jgi:monoamine oxidase
MFSWFGKGARVMTLYYAGNKAITNNQDSLTQMLSRDTVALRLAFPRLRLSGKLKVVAPKDEQFVKYSQPVGYAWATEPYTKGGYSAFSPESYDVMHQTSTYLGERALKLFVPIDDEIFFAGEHTDFENSATMQGAVKSGERAAMQIISHLGRRKEL